MDRNASGTLILGHLSSPIGRGAMSAPDAPRHRGNWRPALLQKGLVRNATSTELGHMKTTTPTTSHKFGANRNELAATPRKHDPNFRQSRDVREDRGQRRMKTSAVLRSGRA
jgi:hypothetical protein